MPGIMPVDISDKGSALGNVFNKAVSSIDGVNSGCAGEGAESDGTQKFVHFQEILGQQMTKNSLCSACPPQKSGKPVVAPGIIGTQKETLVIPLLTGDKLQATKFQAGKEVIKGAKQQKGAELNYSVINEQILNGIFSANTPLQPVAEFPSNPQIEAGESGLQMNNTVIGNGANITSTLFTYTKETSDGIGGETGNASFKVDNQTLLATAGKGVTLEGLIPSAVASAPFVKDATMGSDSRQGKAFPLIDNQAPPATAANKTFQGVTLEGLIPSAVASAPFVKDATMGSDSRQGKAFPLLDNQAPPATAGNKTFQGVPIEKTGINLKEPGVEILKGTRNSQMAYKSGLSNIQMSQLLRNGQSSLSAPSFSIEIQGREFQGLNTGAVISRMPGFYKLPIQNTSQRNDQVFSTQVIFNAPNIAEGVGIKIASDAQGSSPVKKATTNVFQMTKEPNVVSRFYPEQGVVNSTTFEIAAQTTQVSPSLTANEQPTKELLLPNVTDPRQGKHLYREEGASTMAFGSQQDGQQESFEDQPEELNVLDFASLETSAQKTPGDLTLTVNTQPTKESRVPNYLELQHDASISHGNNTTQPSSIEGSNRVMTYLHHDKTTTAGQTQTDIMDQLFQRISLTIHGDKSEIKLHLTPPELGKVKIHFVEENNDVEAKIFVENAEVKATIENNVHHLRESIASSGISIHKLEVYLQNEDTNKQKSLENFSADNFGRQNQGQRHAGQGKNYFEEGKTDDSVVNRESGANASNFIIDYIS